MACSRFQLNLVYLLVISMLYVFLPTASISLDLSCGTDLEQHSSFLRIRRVDCLQRMVEAVKPAFTRGLAQFNRLIDVINNATISMEEKPVNGNFSKLLIQRTIYLMMGSFNQTNSTAFFHLKRYQGNYVRLLNEIKDKEEMIKNYAAVLNDSISNLALWNKKSKQLRQQQTYFESKLRDANNRIKEAEKKIEKAKKNKNWWIVATVFTVGLATPGLIDKVNQLQKVERNREYFRKSSTENLIELEEAVKNIEKLQAEELKTKSSMKDEANQLHCLRLEQNNLNQQSESMRKLGEQIKNITTFTSDFRAQVENVQQQQEIYVLFSPLFEFVHYLGELIGSSGTIIKLLKEEEMASYIRAKIQNLKPFFKKSLI